ncbi:DUF397 domain-containing protein [Streptomyces sp. NPDC001719]
MPNNARTTATHQSWFKSSYSDESGGMACVEVAALTTRVGIRDSKQADGPAITVPTGAWSTFITGVRSGLDDG